MDSVSPTGIVPEDLIDKTKKDEFIRWLTAQGFKSQFKRDLLFGWSRTVFVAVTGEDVRLVRSSGIDVPQGG